METPVRKALLFDGLVGVSASVPWAMVTQGST